MAGDEISEKGRQERFAQWEKIGLDRIKHDLLNGGYRVVGGPLQEQELAWKWVRKKESEATSGLAQGASASAGTASYTPEAARAVYAAIEGLVSAGKRAYVHSVPRAAEDILIRGARVG